VAKNKIKTSDLVVGIDFGDTIFHRGVDGNKVENPRALEVVSYLVKNCRAVYIVSKVNDEQKKRAIKWMYNVDFYRRTGLRRTDVKFCAERHEKGPIAKDLRINCFIDDRPEVMAWMPKDVIKILFNPIPDDVVAWKQENAHIVESWTEVERLLL